MASTSFQSDDFVDLRQRLQQRWEGEQQCIQRICTALRRGEFLSKNLVPWRDEFPSEGNEEQVDLRGISLEGVDLTGVDLSGADLRYAHFFRVRLSNAVISSDERPSSLSSAVLLHCDFEAGAIRKADCTKVHCGHCDFSKADFTATTLDHATLRSCQFDQADFSEASLCNVAFVHSDLKNVQISKNTDFGLNPRTHKQSVGIRLEVEAASRSFDRFQFQDQRAAFASAAKVYAQLAEASENAELREIAGLLRSRERACLEASQP